MNLPLYLIQKFYYFIKILDLYNVFMILFNQNFKVIQHIFNSFKNINNNNLQIHILTFIIIIILCEIDSN
jgi:hypothetical protein